MGKIAKARVAVLDKILTDQFARRFWGRVDVRAGAECWPWLASRFKNTGYGYVCVCYRGIGAHRVAWAINNRKMPDRLVIRHICDNRICVNPNHLIGGTVKDNVQDSVTRKRKPVGEDCSHSKMTNEQVAIIKKRLRSEGVTQIARERGVTVGAISHIKSGKNWRSVLAAD